MQTSIDKNWTGTSKIIERYDNDLGPRFNKIKYKV